MVCEVEERVSDLAANFFLSVKSHCCTWRILEWCGPAHLLPPVLNHSYLLCEQRRDDVAWQHSQGVQETDEADNAGIVFIIPTVTEQTALSDVEGSAADEPAPDKNTCEEIWMETMGTEGGGVGMRGRRAGWKRVICKQEPSLPEVHRPSKQLWRHSFVCELLFWNLETFYNPGRWIVYQHRPVNTQLFI